MDSSAPEVIPPDADEYMKILFHPNIRMEKLVRTLSRLERSTLLGLGIAAAVLIGMPTFWQESRFRLHFLSFSGFLVSWCAGRREGILIALCSSVSWYAAEWYAGRDYSHPAIFYWNLIVMFGFFFMVSYTFRG